MMVAKRHHSLALKPISLFPATGPSRPNVPALTSFVSKQIKVERWSFFVLFFKLKNILRGNNIATPDTIFTTRLYSTCTLLPHSCCGVYCELHPHYSAACSSGIGLPPLVLSLNSASGQHMPPHLNMPLLFLQPPTCRQ